MLEEVLIPIIAMGATFGVPGFILYKFLSMRHKERMAIIDRGLDPQQYKDLYGNFQFGFRQKSSSLGSLKWALLLLFVGAGWLTGAIVMPMVQSKVQDFIMPSLMLISGGLGLLIYYFIASKKLREENSEEKKMEMIEM